VSGKSMETYGSNIRIQNNRVAGNVYLNGKLVDGQKKGSVLQNVLSLFGV
ncbi:MAG: hypothetical protein JWQ78_47, partial [Sediminibacterium sp.]|nr:hypothetical protein [Sediminibacterium sp.]